ncbi:MAG TPA: serine--tRNA ligase [Candidatus Paceibacterota bacterium]|nr:serine--tRNA ligase [Candidatus Paceibacterota bacterium]HPT40308.1 serine--tRNA ligase [Candidatus Paceibacterota bacterium]
MLIDLLKQIRENPEYFKQGVQKRFAQVDIDKIVSLDKEWRGFLGEVEFLRSEQKSISKNKQFSQDDLEKAKSMKTRIKELEEQVRNAEEELDKMLCQIPNMPQDDVPVGDETASKVLREVGEKPKFSPEDGFAPKEYLDLVEDKWIDVKRAAKAIGARFGYLRGDAVLIEYALVRFVFDKLAKHGFIPVVPPAMVSKKSMKGMGVIDSEKDLAERYYFPEDEIFLIGTAEQAIGAMHQDEIFEEKDLPLRYIAFSPCFRKEAGSYGRDTKGILRVHYFEKMEMFIFSKPEDSQKEQELLLQMEEELMQDLGIPYRVVRVSTGDMYNPSSSSYDIEAWMPGQNQYRETHSNSNCTDFQSRRLNIKYKTADGQKFVHTLNGTAFAIGRILIAIIENYQQKDGSIEIPKILKKYM